MQKQDITSLVLGSAPDEAKVSISFIDFLNAAVSLHPSGNHFWNAYRRKFTANFGRVRGDPKARGYVVYVDGELHYPLSQAVKALVECKKYRRNGSVARQEVSTNPQTKNQDRQIGKNTNCPANVTCSLRLLTS